MEHQSRPTLWVHAIDDSARSVAPSAMMVLMTPLVAARFAVRLLIVRLIS